MNLDEKHGSVDDLQCPVTGLGLELVTLETARERIGGDLHPRADSLNAKGILSKPAGLTKTVLLREDLKCAIR